MKTDKYNLLVVEDNAYIGKKIVNANKQIKDISNIKLSLVSTKIKTKFFEIIVNLYFKSHFEA